MSWSSTLAPGRRLWPNGDQTDRNGRPVPSTAECVLWQATREAKDSLVSDDTEETSSILFFLRSEGSYESRLEPLQHSPPEILEKKFKTVARRSEGPPETLNTKKKKRKWQAIKETETDT
ncbi:hypothetical protein RUM44_007659 [Polyplax serrata]|uniref:Uncharacterized protein n=1 Tax=Polyplax serrata TaxID=468196 RepID=A0ABR1B851_POLSC